MLTSSGCSIFSPRVKTTVVWDDGKTIEITSKSDALVVIKKGDEELTADLRGRPGIIEQFFSGLLLGRSKDTGRP